MGVFFVVFGPGMYFQTGQVFFVPKWPNGSLLVFYVGNILVNKNTICNYCIFTGLLVLFNVFKLYGQCSFQAM
jgi:hypothetical protein